MTRLLCLLLLLALPCWGQGRAGERPGKHPDARTVFIGGAGPGIATLADPAAMASLLAAGNIGPYQHANGNAAMGPDARARMWALWAVAPGSGGTVGEVGAPVPPDAGYLSYFGGTYPQEVDMNAVTGSGNGSGTYVAGPADRHPGRIYRGHTTDGDLHAMTAAIDAARAAGARNVAIYMTPNGGGEDLDDPFATGGFWRNVRAAALHGGGIALDVPPGYWLARGQQYQSMVVQIVRWARANGLRSSLAVSPHAIAPDAGGHTGGCGYDAALLEKTRFLVTVMRAGDAMPTQWIVQNYCPTGTANDVAAGPGSLGEVALFLSGVAKAAAPPN